MSKDFLWVEKYRPKTIEDTILPTELKNTFQAVVKTGELPNMLGIVGEFRLFRATQFAGPVNNVFDAKQK